jgi:hypothetical protein
MTITPQTSVYINVLVAVLAAIVNGAISFANLVPDPVNHEIVTWAALILSIFGVINAALHSVSSPSEGPLNGVRIKLEKIPPKVLIFAGAAAFILINLIGHGAAIAADKKQRVKSAHPKEIQAVSVKHQIYPERAEIDAGARLNFVAAGAPVEDVPSWDKPVTVLHQNAPVMSPAVITPKEQGIIGDIWKKLQAVTLSDLQYANNLAINNQDTVASSCYGALITLIQKSQLANVDPATGQPMPLPSVHLVTDLENVIILYRELQPTSATSVACAPLMNAVKVNSISALLSGFGTGGLASGLLLP